MAWIGAVVGAAGGLIGDAMSQQGASATNAQQIAANEQMQQNAMNFDAQQQLQAESFDTQMSDTAYQRGVQGLEAAGLNPLLAAGNPASSPTISAATAPGGNVGSLANPQASFANLGQIGTNAVQTANAAQVQQAQVQSINAQTANTQAQTAQTLSTLPYSGDTAAANLANLQETQRQIEAQAANLNSQYRLNDANMSRTLQDTQFQKELFPLLQQQQQVDLQMSRLGLAPAQNSAAFQNSTWGKILNAVGFGPGGGAAATSSAITSAARAGAAFMP